LKRREKVRVGPSITAASQLEKKVGETNEPVGVRFNHDVVIIGRDSDAPNTKALEEPTAFAVTSRRSGHESHFERRSVLCLETYIDRMMRLEIGLPPTKE